MTLTNEVPASAQTHTSEGEKKSNGGKKLPTKEYRQSLAKKLDVLLEDYDSTRLEEKHAIAIKYR